MLKGTMGNLQENRIDFSTTMIGDITPCIGVIKYGEENYLAKFTALTEENDDVTPGLEAQTEATVYLITSIIRIYWDKCRYLYTLNFEAGKEK